MYLTIFEFLFQISGIHLRLKHMCDVDDAANFSSDFNERIKAFLARWGSLLLPLLGDIHWTCNGMRSVTYIPDHDGIIFRFLFLTIRGDSMARFSAQDFL